MLQVSLSLYHELLHADGSPRNGMPVIVDGQTLSIAAVTAAARYHASVNLDRSSTIKERVFKSRSIISEKVESGASVYGLSTGFGGSGVHSINFESR
jgi:phenylalanine ammonia-lyase